MTVATWSSCSAPASSSEALALPSLTSTAIGTCDVGIVAGRLIGVCVAVAEILGHDRARLDEGAADVNRAVEQSAGIIAQVKDQPGAVVHVNRLERGVEVLARASR